jgi:acetyl-CoA carboxylase biotin carboxyl carrier protein
VELKQVKELMTAMERGGIKKLSIKETNGFELTLERESETHGHPIHHYQPAHSPVEHHHRDTEMHHKFPSPSSSSVKQLGHEESKEKAPGKYVTSPMVGTYYASPSPDDAHFVKVGDRVEENTVVCIIEAMKVMNEVKAGVSGVIAEICVDNAHPVEFGTKIMRIV